MDRRCENVTPVLLDYQYGLLDAAEAAAVESHAATCPACAAALADAAGVQKLFARAAKLPFPDVTFRAPVESELKAPAAKPASPVWWAVAAAVLLAVGGVSLFPAAERQYRIQAAKPDLDARRADVAAAETKLSEAKKAAATAAADRAAKLAAAVAEQDRVYGEWVKADAAQHKAAPYAVAASGPAAAAPGAPNTYDLRVADADGAPAKAAKLTATLRGDDGAVVFTQTYTNAAAAKLTLPAKLWADLPNGGDCQLIVTATDAAGATATLVEPVRLLAPVLVTFLTTDKPLYRPGEPLFVRTLTLDRTRFQPAPVPPSLRYRVLGPDGKPVQKLAATGVTDRGVGNAGFFLPTTLVGGEYTVQALEVPADLAPDKEPETVTVVAARSVLVRSYQDEKLLKTLTFDKSSYGPGDTVRAKLSVLDQTRPFAGNFLPTLSAPVETGPNIGRLDAAGAATIEFKLPATLPDTLTLNVQLLDPPAEAILRPVPLAHRKVALEFFAEGGDLILGVPNRVYFRATLPSGRPADVAGTLSDGANQLAAVRTLTDDEPGANRGLGVFTVTPEAGKTYTVKLHSPANAEQPQGGYPLPKATNTGVTLSVPTGVTAADEPVRVTLHAAGAKRTLLVGAYVRGAAAAHANAVVEPGKPTEVTLKPGSRGGVVRVTVFELIDGRDAKPVAERLVFRRPVEQLNLKLAADRATYIPGDGVKIDIAATTETGAATPAILYAAVVNKSVLAMADDRTERLLPSHFLLAGETQSPDKLEYADFLLSPHPKAAQALDLLLGTQGWRRFAEQTPGQFRGSVPADEAQRFLISTGAKAAVPGRPLFDDPAAAQYRAAYVAATAAVEQVEADATAEAADKALLEAETSARNAAAAERILQSTAYAEPIGLSAVERLGMSLGVVSVAACAAVLLFVRRPTARKWLLLFAAAAAAFAVGVAVFTTPGRPDAAERSTFASVGATVESTAAATAPASGAAMTRSSTEAGIENPGTARPAEAFKLLDSGLFRGDKLNAHYPATLFNLTPPVPRKPRAALVPPAEQKAAARVNRKIAVHPAFAVRQYAHARADKPAGDATRTDFTETVYWHPLIVTPEDGRASLNFHLSDSVNAYRVLVAGHTPSGRLGASTLTLEVRQPLAVDFRLPAELTVGDVLHLPVTAANNTDADVEATLDVWSDLLPAADGSYAVTAPARKSGGTTVPLLAAAKAGVAKVRVAAKAGTLADAVERTVAIVPDGFPTSAAANATVRGTHTLNVTVPGHLVPGTLKAKLTVHTNALGDLQSGLDGLLREPHGCFEQTSSANYPNVLALDYMKVSGAAGFEKHAGILDRGHAKLVAFEVPKKAAAAKEGFEWFGQYPPHPALTAYGLVQFADTAKVHVVDPALITRTRDYLLSLRDGKGGFALPRDGHSFGHAPPAVVTAYIVYVLSEVGADTKAELDEVVKAAGTDSYRLALAAIALANTKDARAEAALKQLARLQTDAGGLPAPEATIVRSGPEDGTVEATALAAAAWLKGGPAFFGNARLAAKFLLAQRTPNGTFGATQATVLALKALTALAKLDRRQPETGTITVRVDGLDVAKVPFAAADPDPVVVPFDRGDAQLAAGAHTIEVICSGKEEYPFSFTWEARTGKPNSDAKCSVSFAATLAKSELRQGEATQVRVALENRTADETGMATAVVGLPAGLTVPVDSRGLKKLVEDGTVSHWEIVGRELVVYWRGLGPKQKVEFSVDVLAAVPGEFRGPAGRAYLYYNPQSVTWTDPLRVRIAPSAR